MTTTATRATHPTGRPITFEEAAALATRLDAEVGRVIIGQPRVRREILTCLLAGGHCLLRGVPGLAKTLLIKTLAESVNLKFSRIQFTPDLMPSDILGTEVIEDDAAGKRHVRFIPGPVFANIILADEINRTPPRTQAALLEAMQEYQVTVGGVRHALERPLFVLATENPIEQEGTYPLPEAQVDRFMLKLAVDYPTDAEELEIMRRMSTGKSADVKPVVTPAELLRARAAVEMIYMDPQVERYIVDLVLATRNPAAYGLKDLTELIRYGASPRATICLAKTARAHAFLRHRGFVTPDDVRAMGLDVLRHRVIITYEAEAEEVTPEDVVRRVLDSVEVP